MKPRFETPPVAERGFAVVPGRELLHDPEPLHSALLRLAADAPLDPYVQPPTRFRRHDKLVYLPWSRDLVLLPLPCYYRDLPQWPTGGRTFSGLGTALYGSDAFRELIAADLFRCPFGDIERCFPIEVGVNLIKIRATPEQCGFSHPDKPHRDGERYVAIHLLERFQVTGGDNAVFDDAGALLWRGLLADRFDTLLVDDVRVLHQVERVHVLPPADEGFRTVLIIDMTPMRAFRG